MPTSPAYCCYTTLGNTNFYAILADLFCEQSCLNDFETWRWNLTNERFSYCCIVPGFWAECWCRRCFIYLCHYCDADIFQQGSVPAHWCVHQTVELLQRETLRLTVWQGLWPPFRPVWMKEKVVVIRKLCWTIIVLKNWIFFSMCNRNIWHLLLKSLRCNSNFPQVVVKWANELIAVLQLTSVYCVPNITKTSCCL